MIDIKKKEREDGDLEGNRNEDSEGGRPAWFECKCQSIWLPSHLRCNAMLQSPFHTQLQQHDIAQRDNKSSIPTHCTALIITTKRVSLATRWHRQRAIFC